MALDSLPVCAVILAGGPGRRLWPLSRRERPKPFTSPVGGPTLLERTWSRLADAIPPESIFVAAEKRLAAAVCALLPHLPPENLMLEPVARDTAAAVLHAAWLLEHRRPGSVVIFLPADHLVADKIAFRHALRVAVGVVLAEDGLCCLGIPPVSPLPQYGYLVCRSTVPRPGEFTRVDRFVEKPGADEAERLIAGKRSLWNAGIFIGRAARFLAEAHRVNKDLSDPLHRLEAGGDSEQFFREVPKVSFDRAVMERSDRIWVVGADVGWDDLGGWEAAGRHLPGDLDGNRSLARCVAIDARDCIVHSAGKPVLLLGVEGLVVVETDQVLLVADRRQLARLRDVEAILVDAGEEILA